MKKILVIDDEPAQRKILSDILGDAGYVVQMAADGNEGAHLIQLETYQAVLTDLKMPGKDGLELLMEVQVKSPFTQVIIMTAFGTIPGAVAAIKKGAYDYLTKPFEKDDLLRIIAHAVEKSELLSENQVLRSAIQSRHQYYRLIGKSSGMLEVYNLIERVKDIPVGILITGASGSGKEMVARAIHYSGNRKDHPFVAINAGAIPETLIESELFGHEKGAFTGAGGSYAGKFEQANHGTLFLDEIGTMRHDLQVRLLRVLQDKTIQRLGSAKSVELDVRIIAATNINLETRVATGAFREDLYHRLNVLRIPLPPLSERREDIALLAHHFLQTFMIRYNRPGLELSARSLSRLEDYHWPGNVRELENLIEKTVILCPHLRIEPEHLMFSQGSVRRAEAEDHLSLPERERRAIAEAMELFDGSIKLAADHLGISYKTLQYRLKKYMLKAGERNNPNQ